MISRGNSIKDEPVPEPAGEAHSHSGARHCVGVLLSRYRIVEWPVQMTEWDIDGAPTLEAKGGRRMSAAHGSG